MDDHDHSADEDSSDDRSRHGDGHDPVDEGNEATTVDADGERRVERSMLEGEAEGAHDAEREIDEQYERDADHGGGGHDHGDHGGMHAGHERPFRRRFFVSTLLSIPVLLYSEPLQKWLGFSAPAFPGSVGSPAPTPTRNSTPGFSGRRSSPNSAGKRWKL